MTDTTFGPEIAVNGKRPDWLGDGVVGLFENSPGTWLVPERLLGWGWNEKSNDGKGCPVSIRLPADSPVYKALDAGFEPWPGGDAAPADWDEGDVLHDDGNVYPANSYQWKWGWPHSPARRRGDIIGYHKRTPAAATPADAITIARMTEAEADALIKRFDYGLLDILKHLGLLKPETTADRFTRETGHQLPSDLSPEMRALFEAALAWERGK